MDASNPLPASYADSRAQFRELTKNALWQQAVPLPISAGQGSKVATPRLIRGNQTAEPLTVDVAYLGPKAPERTVLVTSGLHGVEGFFGAAVQLKLLEHFASQSKRPTSGLLMVHALNPDGFARRRRWNEQNVDLNRNFLLPGEAYAGAPAHYGQLNTLLNPSYPPRKLDGFHIKALRAIYKHGFAALQQTIAGGQYEYPQGLFFGGAEPSATYRLLEKNLRAWLGEAREVIHLDFHTGLGRWGMYQLLMEEPLESKTGRWLQATFGERVVRSPHNTKAAYQPRGGLGAWCKHQLSDREYIYACAEFGTYSPLKMLTGLRAENQARWYSPEGSPARKAAATRLKELFCPASKTWRNRVVEAGARLTQTAMTAKGLP